MLKQNGLTLIVLIITVIILLILASVTLVLVLGENGSVKQTQHSSVDYRDNVSKEDAELAWSVASSKYFEKSINNSDNKTDVNYSYTFPETGETINVGDIVKYDSVLAKAENAVNLEEKAQLINDLNSYSGYNSSIYNAAIDRDNLVWKVLDIKDGKIRLISNTPTTKNIALYNYNGYNNGVYLIDKACDVLYSVNGVGKAQNLKIEDIEEKININVYNYKNECGKIITYTSNLFYPNLYSNEIGCKAISNNDNTGNKLGLSQQIEPVTGYSTAINQIVLTQTYWSKSMNKSDFINEKYYNFFINNGSTNYNTYWLSSRCVDCSSSYAFLGIRFVKNDGWVSHCGLYRNNGTTDNSTCKFRPVVTLDPSVVLKIDSINEWIIQ